MRNLTNVNVTGVESAVAGSAADQDERSWLLPVAIAVGATLLLIALLIVLYVSRRKAGNRARDPANAFKRQKMYPVGPSSGGDGGLATYSDAIFRTGGVASPPAPRAGAGAGSPSHVTNGAGKLFVTQI